MLRSTSGTCSACFYFLKSNEVEILLMRHTSIVCLKFLPIRLLGPKERVLQDNIIEFSALLDASESSDDLFG